MVGADYIKLIWVPDTFFVNEKEARFHAATQVLLCFVVVFFFSIFIFLFSLYFHIVDVVVVVVFQLFSTTGALVVVTV